MSKDEDRNEEYIISNTLKDSENSIVDALSNIRLVRKAFAGYMALMHIRIAEIQETLSRIEEKCSVLEDMLNTANKIKEELDENE